jgi:hypothetical protein
VWDSVVVTLLAFGFILYGIVRAGGVDLASARAE